MNLEKMPKPDGAPFRCCVHIRKDVWPYVSRCKHQPVGLLSEADYSEASREFDLAGRMVCQDHADRIGQYLLIIAGVVADYYVCRNKEEE